MTIKDLCEMMVANGECKLYKPININGKTYCDNNPTECDQVDKYWKKQIKEQKNGK